MASPGNPNQPFDVHKFFIPSTGTSAPIAGGASSPVPSPNSQNPNPSSPFPLSSFPLPHSAASYPPPTGGPFSYPPQTTPFHHPQYLHHHIPPFPQPQQDNQFSSLHTQKSMPYASPPLHPPSPRQFQSPQNSNPTAGARLMALLSGPPPSTLEAPQQLPGPTIPMPSSIQPPSSSGGSSDFSMPPNAPIMPPAPNGMVGHPAPMRTPSSKLPKGRHLVGDQLVYDIDVRLPGEVQPQLEVTPITKYGSDPGLVLGRQIAVNRTYICYGLKLGAVRVLNINTALRSLLKGLSQRVTDMSFFADDVHLLAGASNDGRVYVWKITEGTDEEDKRQITGRIVIAIQIVGEEESVFPRVCWHCHKQEVLVVGIGRHILRIDTTKVGKGEVYSAEEPLRCPIDKLIDGVQLVGTHDGEVSDLSMCQWMTTRLVSASMDGTIKIWEDRKLLPIAVLKPHDGQPVNSVTFLASPQRPDHILLITGGPLNHEVKIWVSASEEGWLLPSDAESWLCTQALVLRSSAEARLEEAFFNQVAALSQAGLLLLANAKKNAIYAIHLEYGSNPGATRMDYIAEFTVTMPILSFTGTSELLPHGERIVQVYCVQTQAIQQYALNLSQCVPSTMENMVFERADSFSSHDAANTDGFTMSQPYGGKSMEIPSSCSVPSSFESASMKEPVSPVSADTALREFTTSRMDSKAVSLPLTAGESDTSVLSPLPLSPRLSKQLSGLGSSVNSCDQGAPPANHVGEQKVVEYSVDRQIDPILKSLSEVPSLDDESRTNENKAVQNDNATVHNHHVHFRHPTHLVTPAEILMGNSSSETIDKMDQKGERENKVQDVAVNTDMRNVEVDVKVLGETQYRQNTESGSQDEAYGFATENGEKSFCSQASDLGIEIIRDRRALSTSTYVVEGPRQVDGHSGGENVVQSAADEEVRDSVKVVAGDIADSTVPATAAQSYARGKKQKGKTTNGASSSSLSPSEFNLADSSVEHGCSVNPSAETVLSQITTMQETLNQLASQQKDIQKQMSALITAPITKEGKRLETAFGRSLEKAVKSNVDAMWARFQEENAKQEKLARDRMQQITNLITNCMNKDLQVTVEKTMKKEIAAIGPAVTRTITPSIEKAISTAILEAFQRGVGDKAINQLEKSVNSKLEATVARQIQTQFQTSGKQALQEALRSSLEGSVIPAFEVSCKALFDQVDATFQKGMVEHLAAAQLQLESTHTQIGLSLRDAINSASSVTKMLSGELADGQRKLLALAIAGASPKTGNPLVSQLSNGPLGSLHEKMETSLDPTIELSRMISERKYEEAFTAALQRSDVSIVSWLCAQVDLQGILSMNPLPLSQGVLISLLQQLACDINKETPRKLSWMRDVVVAINPADPMISAHVRVIFDQVYHILNHHRSIPTTSNADVASIRVVMHIINSMLMTTCK